MRITLYLLRSGVRLSKDTLRRHSLYEEWQLRQPVDDSVEWRLFVRVGMDREVRWLETVRPLLADNASRPLLAKTAAGVLLVQVRDRVFAVTFGHGFHAIDNATCEPDFGLRVAANCVDPDKINLADARGLGKGRRNATSRLPVPNDVFALGLITDEEWIRKFGGEVKVTGFAKSVAGADALQLNIDDFSLLDLPSKLGQALDLFREECYREHFPFLDYFKRETDKDLMTQLDAAIADGMRHRDPEIGFALPDEFNLTADVYALTRYRRQELVAELLTERVYEAIDTLDGWKDPLKAVKVEAYDLSSELVSDREPLRTYVVGSTRYDMAGQQRDYTLTAGSWFRIDQEYVAIVNRYLRDRVKDETDDLDLPEWDDEYLKEHVPGRYGEERYNKHVGAERPYAVLDRDLYRGQAGERVEICDLLTPDRRLICVKRMDGSDKMSHLFQQGSVSARMLMTNDALPGQDDGTLPRRGRFG